MNFKRAKMNPNFRAKSFLKLTWASIIIFVRRCQKWMQMKTICLCSFIFHIWRCLQMLNQAFIIQMPYQSWFYSHYVVRTSTHTHSGAHFTYWSLIQWAYSYSCVWWDSGKTGWFSGFSSSSPDAHGNYFKYLEFPLE